MFFMSRYLLLTRFFRFGTRKSECARAVRVCTVRVCVQYNAGCRDPSVAGVTAAVPAPSVVAERTAAAVQDAFPHGKTDARTVRHHPNQHGTRPNGPNCHRTVRESVVGQLPAWSTCV